MTISARQYQNLQAEACHIAEQLPPGQLLNGLSALYDAGRLLHMSKSSLAGLLGSVVLHCIDDQSDADAPLAPPEPGLWPRVIQDVAYDEHGNLLLAGVDDNDHPWSEHVSGRSQEAWLLKQLYVERRFGRRSKKCKLLKKSTQTLTGAV